jgi:hypothetical protein
MGCGPNYELWTEINMQENNSLDSQSAAVVQVGGTHYLRPIQPFDIVKVWGLGFFRGNVIKYVLRCLDKNGKEDLRKARHYIDYCIENYDELMGGHVL